MESDDSKVAFDCRFFRVFKDGGVQRHRPIDKVPPADDLHSGLRSRDVVVSPETGVSARLFLPKIIDPVQKIPILFYIHGGGFSLESAFSPRFDAYLKTLASQANAIAVGVEYRLAPEHPIPACYDDSWAALRWVASHADGNGPEPWLNCYADLNRIVVAGDSAGANIAHTVMCRVGSIGLAGAIVVGLVLVHPYFGGTDDDVMWLYMCPINGGLQDPRLRPTAEDLATLRCGRVLVFLAGDDHLRDVGWDYCEKLKKSGWEGTVEIVESHRERHVFHLMNPTCDNAAALTRKIVSFLNEE